MRDGSATSGGSWPTVGRETELRFLTAALDDPECGGVVLVGGAGFGKTRLAGCVAGLARDRSLAHASVRATKSGADIPFAALAPLLAEFQLSPELGADLFRSLAAAVDDHRGRRRMVLVVDDAQELDDASVVLLDQLAERGTVFLVLTMRSGTREIDALVSLWKEQHILRLEVGPLADGDLRSLARLSVDGPLDDTSLATLVESSQGNVLFLRELIQGAVDSGVLAPELGLWRLRGSPAHSPRLRDLIEERLLGLGDQEREALELVALGDPLPFTLLERLVPLAAIERLEDRRLLDVQPTDHGPELRLNHPLHGEVVRAHLPAVRRTRLCRALADAAEADGLVDVGDTLRVAVWRLDGAAGAPLAPTLAATRTALRMEDYALAIRLAGSAWRQWHSLEAALLLADALDFAGRSQESLDVLAAAEALATGDAERTSLTVRRASALFISFGAVEEADRLIAEARSQVADPGCRRQLDALQGNHLLMGGDVAGAIALDRELLAGPSDAASAQASLDMGVGLAMTGRTAEAIEHTDTALALRTNLDDEAQLSAAGVYLVAQALARFHAGDLAGAEAIGHAGYQVSAERTNVHGLAWFASVLGLIYLTQGRPRTSASIFREAANRFADLDHPGQRWGLGGIALASAHLGETEVGLAALEELDGLPPTSVHLQDVAIVRARAWTALVAGERSTARALLADAVELAERWGQHAAASEALHDLVRMGADGDAADRLADLRAEVDGDAMAARLAFARAVAGGDPEGAAEAADRFEAMGAHLFAAESAAVEGRLAEGKGLKRRASAARSRSERLLGRCEGSHLPWLPRAGDATRLSDREREVALLAAQDLSSKEIAERLFVSARTVDNHLQRVYVKLGISGRGELAAHL